jgi:hypothetical protein
LRGIVAALAFHQSDILAKISLLAACSFAPYVLRVDF